MELSKKNKREVIQYLLGAAAAEEQMAVEERYLSDQDFFEQVVAVEKELLDDYARDRLSTSERELFERLYLAHPKRRARAMTAVALVSTLDRLQLPEVPLVPAPVRRASWLETSLRNNCYLVTHFGVESDARSQRYQNAERYGRR